MKFISILQWPSTNYLLYEIEKDLKNKTTTLRKQYHLWRN
jgi:hypothetical protein